jgi:hypothetical protein
MGFVRKMVAGFAGSSNINAPSGGGNKKSGLTSTMGTTSLTIGTVRTRTIGNARERSKICFVNQLSGVGRGRSMFNVPGMYTNVHGSFGPTKPLNTICFYP